MCLAFVFINERFCGNISFVLSLRLKINPTVWTESSAPKVTSSGILDFGCVLSNVWTTEYYSRSTKKDQELLALRNALEKLE